MNTKELEILLALNGNKRIPHLEAEIFADENLLLLYLNILCGHYRWYTELVEKENACAWYVCRYAKLVLNCRWLEAESYLRQSNHWIWYVNIFQYEFRYLK